MSRDDRWIEEIAAALEPRPMSADRARAFRLEFDRRLRPAHRPWRSAALAAAATASLALSLWTAQEGSAPNAATPRDVVAERAPVPSEPKRLASRAVSTEAEIEPLWAGTLDELEDVDAAVAPRRYLPPDYLVLASFVADDVE